MIYKTPWRNQKLKKRVVVDYSKKSEEEIERISNAWVEKTYRELVALEHNLWDKVVLREMRIYYNAIQEREISENEATGKDRSPLITKVEAGTKKRRKV